jgi:hypothetical protein
VSWYVNDVMSGILQHCRKVAGVRIWMCYHGIQLLNGSPSKIKSCQKCQLLEVKRERSMEEG